MFLVARASSKPRGGLFRKPPPVPEPAFPPALRPGNLIPAFRRSLASAKRDLADGAVARALAVAVLYPLDSSKVRLQLSSGGRRASSVVGRLAATGPRAWGGVSAAVLGGVAYGVVGFGVFEALRGALRDGVRGSEEWAEGRRIAVAACFADLAAGVVSVPAEVVKTKVQGGVYAGAWSGTRCVVRSGALWQGFVGHAMRDVPGRALQLALYAAVADKWRVRVRDGGDLSKWDAVGVGAVVGGVVGAVTTPLDVVRSRLMAQRSGAARIYSGWYDCFSKSVRVEGVGSLMRGSAQRTVYMAASVALFSLGYEASKKVIKEKGILWHANVADGKRRR